jgi:hypothetical protein
MIMHKLHLKLDDLEVESFDVGEKPLSRGTVHGNGRYTQDEFSCRADTCSGGVLCACDTYEQTYCMACETYEHSYCAICL